MSNQFQYFKVSIRPDDERYEYNICLRGLRRPTLDEARDFVKMDAEKYGGKVVSVTPIDKAEDRAFFDFSSEESWPIFGYDLTAEEGRERWKMRRDVVELCPYCEQEAEFKDWSPAENGYAMRCPHCGNQVLICSECPAVQGGVSCDWSEVTGRCVMMHENAEKKAVWMRLGVRLMLTESELDVVMNGTMDAVKSLIESKMHTGNGFEINGDSYVPETQGEEDADNIIPRYWPIEEDVYFDF